MQIGFDITSEGASKKAAPTEEAPTTEPMRPRTTDRRAPDASEQSARRRVRQTASLADEVREGEDEGYDPYRDDYADHGSEDRRLSEPDLPPEPRYSAVDPFQIEDDHFNALDPVDPYAMEGPTEVAHTPSSAAQPNQDASTGYAPFHDGPGGYDLGQPYRPVAAYDNACPYCGRVGCSPDCPGPSGGSQPCPSCGATAQVHDGHMTCDTCGLGHAPGSMDDTDPESAGNRRFTGAKSKPDPSCPKCDSAAITYGGRTKQFGGFTSKCSNCNHRFNQEHAYDHAPKVGARDVDWGAYDAFMKDDEHHTPNYAEADDHDPSAAPPSCRCGGALVSEGLDDSGRNERASCEECGKGYSAPARRRSAAAWPKVDNPHFPGETTSACPKCNSTSIEHGADWAPTGTGAGGRGRMGDPGATEYKRCKDCGHTERRTASKETQMRTAYSPQNDDFWDEGGHGSGGGSTAEDMHDFYGDPSGGDYDHEDVSSNEREVADRHAQERERARNLVSDKFLRGSEDIQSGSRHRQSVHTEADLLQAMASTKDYEEQRRIAVALEEVRHQQRLAREDETSIDLGDEMVHDTLTPVLTHAHHTTATDWMTEVTPGHGESQAKAVEAMATLANRWFSQVSAAVREDQEEFNIQARGYARVHSSRHGDHAAAAADAFLRQVAFLQRRTAENEPGPGSGLPQVDDIGNPAVMWPITDAAPGAMDPAAVQPINPVPPTYADDSETPDTEHPGGGDTLVPNRPAGATASRVAAQGMWAVEAKSGVCGNYVDSAGGCANCGKTAQAHVEEARRHPASRTAAEGQNTYVCHWRGKKIEVKHDTSYGAQQVAQKQFGAKKGHEISVMLAEKGGKPVVHDPAVLGSRDDEGQFSRTNSHKVGDAWHDGDKGDCSTCSPNAGSEADRRAERHRRNTSSLQTEAASTWSPMSGKNSAQPKPFKATHTFHPIGWDQFDARPHPGSDRIAAGSPVMSHGKMDPGGHLLHIQDEHGNNQTVDKRSLQRGTTAGLGAWVADKDDDEDDLNGRKDTTPATGSENEGPTGEGSTLPEVGTLGVEPGVVDQPWVMDQNVPGTGAAQVEGTPAPGIENPEPGWPQPTASLQKQGGGLIKGKDLTAEQRSRIPGQFPYRWTHENQGVEGRYPGGEVPTMPKVSDDAWLDDHAFRHTNGGDLMRGHAEPNYLADEEHLQHPMYKGKKKSSTAAKRCSNCANGNHTGTNGTAGCKGGSCSCICSKSKTSAHDDGSHFTHEGHPYFTGTVGATAKDCAKCGESMRQQEAYVTAWNAPGGQKAIHRTCGNDLQKQSAFRVKVQANLNGAQGR